MTMLVQYERARAALAEATRIDEVMSIRDEMAHAKLYARQIKDRELMAEAAEIQMRVERRLGVLLDAAEAAGELAQRGRQPKSSDPEHLPPVTLAELGVDRKLAATAKRTASISEQAFEAMVAAKRRQVVAGRPINLNPQINGARTVMGSRVEPDDSLDYFPTPPWATRALVEHVFPQLGVRDHVGRQSAWEPACGEGHIAEALREYFADVVATDIHPYGYGEVHDFLDDDVSGGEDWIITNPPFGDKAEAFVNKALRLARVGVAMFMRMQWLDSIGRYERIFLRTPPTQIVFFAERVNLCKGRWDPEGGTATPYIWLVWLKDRAPVAPFWIPPGQREALAKADDVERFTAQPVIRKDHPVDATGAPLAHDEATGEIIEDNSALPDPDDRLRPAGEAAAAAIPGSINQAAAANSTPFATAADAVCSGDVSTDAHGCTASAREAVAAALPVATADIPLGEHPMDIPAFLRRRDEPAADDVVTLQKAAS